MGSFTAEIAGHFVLLAKNGGAQAGKKLAGKPGQMDASEDRG